jgi:hypothetical protein
LKERVWNKHRKKDIGINLWKKEIETNVARKRCYEDSNELSPNSCSSENTS